MRTGTTLRPVHVVAAETGAHRVSELACMLDAAERVSHPHVLPPEVVTRAGDERAEERLRQELELVQDAARAALADGGLLLLVDGRAALVVPELMRILMDEEGKGWDEAWQATTETTVARLGSPGDQPGPLWAVDLLEETCPRLLEIIYEVNRRHLAEVEARWPGDVDRQRNT
jgi:glucan phosphorylase